MIEKIKQNPKAQKAITIIILLVILLLSFFPVTNWATSTETHAHTIASLDEKRETVLELTAASALASTAISVLPGDVATPIADKLVDLSGYFLLILGAIYVEKFLVTLTGYAAFRILIPVACILGMIAVFHKHHSLRIFITKLVAFAILLFALIPASIQVSDIIDATYQESIDATIEDAKEASESVDTSTSDETSTSNSSTEESSKSSDSSAEDSSSWLSNFFDTASDTVSSTVDSVTSAVSYSVEEFQNLLNSFIDAIAVLIVTTCLLPLAVLFFFIWIIKMFLNLPGNPQV